MSDDMLNVALPSVARDLEIGVSEMQWVVNGYFVTMLSRMLTAVSRCCGHRVGLREVAASRDRSHACACVVPQSDVRRG